MKSGSQFYLQDTETNEKFYLINDAVYAISYFCVNDMKDVTGRLIDIEEANYTYLILDISKEFHKNSIKLNAELISSIKEVKL